MRPTCRQFRLVAPYPLLEALAVKARPERLDVVVAAHEVPIAHQPVHTIRLHAQARGDWVAVWPALERWCTASGSSNASCLPRAVTRPKGLSLRAIGARRTLSVLRPQRQVGEQCERSEGAHASGDLANERPGV
jgi:hypothetical protein